MVSASVSMLNKIRNTRRKKTEPIDMKDLENNMLDIIRLSSACYCDISTVRKENMKSGLAERYRPLCSREESNDSASTSTEWLFGDNLAQKIKDLGESSKLSTALASSNSSQNFKHPSKNYQRGRPYYYQQKVSRGDDPRRNYVNTKKNQKQNHFNQQYKKNY